MSLTGIRPHIINSLDDITKIPDIRDVHAKKLAILDEVDINSRFLFGKQFIPTAGQTLKQFFTGILNPIGANRATQSEISLHNRGVVRRAKILSYSEKVLGKKIPVRIESAGMGGGGKIPMRIPIPAGYVLPEWYGTVIVPTGQDVSPKISHWTDEQKAHYVESGGYTDYLANGGEEIPELWNIFVASISDEGLGTDTPGDIEAGRIAEEEAAKAADEVAKEPPNQSGGGGQSPESPDMPDDPAILKKTPRSIFSRIMAKQRRPPNVIATLWKSKGAKKWVEDYITENGQPRNDSDITKMRNIWLDTYRYPPLGTPANEYPDVPTDQPPKDSQKPPEDSQTPPEDSQTPPEDSQTPPKDGEGGKHDDKLPDTDPEQLITDKQAFIEGYMGTTGYSKEVALQEYDIHMHPSKYSGFVFDPIERRHVPIFNPPLDEMPDTKKPEPGEKTSTGSPGDNPDFSITKIDTTPKEDDPEKKKKKDEPFPPPFDPRDPPRDPKKPPESEEEKEKQVVDADNLRKNPAGYLRPLFERGGQRELLTLSNNEQKREDIDYRLFDLPVPDADDMSNPMFVKNLRDERARFYGRKNTWHPTNFYRPPIRKLKYPEQLIQTMQPLFRPSDPIPTNYYDPHNNQQLIVPNDNVRSAAATIKDIQDRRNFYTDITRATYTPDPYPQLSSKLNFAEISLSMK